MTSSTQSKPKVLLMGTIKYAQAEWEALGEIAELVTYESTSRKEFLADLKGKYSDIVAINRTVKSAKSVGLFDEEIANALPDSLKYIAHNGAGYDQIDVKYFTPRGIKISHTPGTVDAATADTNLFLILGALRNFAWGQDTLKAGNWLKDVEIGHDPEGKVLGIIGMGGIGRAVRDRVAPLGFKKVIYYNRHRLDPQLEKDSVYVGSIEELLSQSDVVSLNCPLNSETRHLINNDRLSKAKDGVVIVNTARGPVVDENALVEALESGKVGAVGLDVFEKEPIVHPGLLKHPRTFLLPHMGTYTVESRKKMEVLVIDNIRSGLETGKLLTQVPEQRGVL